MWFHNLAMLCCCDEPVLSEKDVIASSELNSAWVFFILLYCMSAYMRDADNKNNNYTHKEIAQE